MSLSLSRHKSGALREKARAVSAALFVIMLLSVIGYYISKSDLVRGKDGMYCELSICERSGSINIYHDKAVYPGRLDEAFASCQVYNCTELDAKHRADFDRLGYTHTDRHVNRTHIEEWYPMINLTHFSKQPISALN